MSLVESKDGIQHFTFEHNRDYQQVQFKFFDAVESVDPNNIVVILFWYSRLIYFIFNFFFFSTHEQHMLHYVCDTTFLSCFPSGSLATQPISYWFSPAAVRCMSHAGRSRDSQRSHWWGNSLIRWIWDQWPVWDSVLQRSLTINLKYFFFFNFNLKYLGAQPNI